MPEISVAFRRDKLEFKTSEKLKEVVRSEVIRRFSTNEVTLTSDGFTFLFHEEGLWDELTHDVIVKIPLHFFPARLVVSTNTNAREIATAITKALHDLTDELSVGVLLPFSELGWGAQS